MCGRFAFFSPREAVQELFGVDCGVDLQPRYNIAPTQTVAALRTGAAGSAEVALLRWGLVPSWAKDPAIGNRMINARLETAAAKPAFRAAFSRRRCAVLADGFYEWQQQAGPKQPWFISAAAGGPFLMAGLWEHWDKSDSPLQTCAILTTAAGGEMRAVHHRMPVILPPQALDAWLTAPGSDGALEVLDNLAEVKLHMQPVSRAVNNPAHEGPDLIRPLEAG